MKTRLFVIPVLLLAAALTPAQADVAFVYAHRADSVHVNVFRPVGGQPAAASEPEVSMFFGKLDVLVDPNEWGYPEQGGCVDIYLDGVFDAGCGELTVEPDGVMGTTRISGVIESSAFSYSPETGFEDLGPSTITIDLTVTGTGPVELSPYTNYAVGVCGLPPDTRGVFADARPELQRTATMSGVLSSGVIGSVDPGPLPSLLVQAGMTAVGACI